MAGKNISGTQRRGFLDHDMFLDAEQRIYFVLGHYQPPDRVISVLKYVPDPRGTWIRAPSGLIYARTYWHQGIEAIEASDAAVKATADPTFDEWTIIDPVFSAPFLEVPVPAIDTRLLPEERLTSILGTPEEGLDAVEMRVRLVVQTILDNFGMSTIQLRDVGITGSILWKGHSDRSDINLNVYGLSVCHKLNEILLERAAVEPDLGPGLQVRAKDFSDVDLITVAPDLPASILARKPKLVFDGFSPGIQIRWCLRAGEFPIAYDTERYTESGVATVKVRIVSDRFGLFLPAILAVETIEGTPAIDRIMIYDTRLVRLFRTGDVVQITGLVQEINDSGVFQLLLGSRDHAGEESVRFLDAIDRE
jgi:predicted nucleotidyltransferase